MESKQISADKVQILQTKVIELLKNLPADAKGLWGVMNGQQMVEHLIDIVQVGNGKKSYPSILTPEHLAANKAFMLSEKPFRQNSRNAFLPEIPAPVHYLSMEEAINALEQETADFVEFFKSDPTKIQPTPIFGDLSYEEWVYLLYKHTYHHLKQFGLVS